MTPNPPIRGHELKAEGHVWRTWVDDLMGGGCRCGAKPPEFPNVSIGAMKRWHREHKAEVRRIMYGAPS